MSTPIIIGVIVLSIIAVATITAITVTKLYKRTKKGMAFVKTGFGGEKVVIDGGAIVLPILHEITWVSMQTRKITVTRDNKSSLITKDKFRVDVSADFYLRVKQNAASVAIAAQSLGQGATQDVQLKALMESKFVDALRSVTSTMNMNDLHEKRSEFVQTVQTNVQDELEKNGIELESVSLISLDQTNIDNLDPNNAFDAEGMTQLTQITEDRKKIRNDIEQTNLVAIQEKNLQTQKRTIDIKQQEELAKADQEKTIKMAQANRERETEEAQITAARMVAEANIQKDRAVREAEIARNQAIEIAEQQKNINIFNKSKEESASEADANAAKALAVSAEEKIQTAKVTEIATREKTIAIINAERSAEELAVGIKVAASAEKQAAEDKASAVLIAATAEADSIKLKASAREAELLAEASGQEAINLAQNKLSPEIVRMNIQIETITHADKIIAAMMKPVEKIDGIKMVNISGLTGGAGLASGNGGNGGGSAINDLFSGLMNYKATMPFIDDILKDAGFDASSPQNLLKSLEVAKDAEDVTAHGLGEAVTAQNVFTQKKNSIVGEAATLLQESSKPKKD